MTDENTREMLGGVIDLIRFPVMNEAFFFNIVARSGILTPAEALDVALKIKGSKPRGVVRFPNQARKGSVI